MTNVGNGDNNTICNNQKKKKSAKVPPLLPQKTYNTTRIIDNSFSTQFMCMKYGLKLEENFIVTIIFTKKEAYKQVSIS